MELDDLKEKWAAHGAMLERCLAIDEHLLVDGMHRKVRSALLPYVLWRALECALGFSMLFTVIPVLLAHGVELRYVVAGGATVVFLGAITALCVHLLVHCLRLDYSGPVAAMQRGVERMRVAEYCALKWAVLGGVLVWLPAALMLFEAFTDFHALAQVGGAWLVANLIFGLVVLAIGQVVSRRYVERTDLQPWARRLVDAVSGRALRAAARHLADVTHFLGEEPRAGA